ncbi:MAG: endolytic transglycosylase MltG [Acidobacteria bacterium]|nr:endolytic transglycosylase MltG [Acidobacteriota bacterium]
MKMRFYIAVTLLICLSIVVGFLFLFVFFKEQPVSATIRVEKGESIAQIADNLYQNKVINTAMSFRIGTRIFRVERKIKAGFYRFEGRMTLYKVIMELTTGKDRLVRLTFPEGLTCQEMFALLTSQHLGTEENYLALFNHPADMVPPEFGEVQTLEGFLFPDTYLCPERATEREIIQQMIHQFQKRFRFASGNATVFQPLTAYQRLILASLVEKETSREGERPLVASVFLNRLRIHMKLDCDPTIIYSLMREGRWDGNIRKSDMSMEDPYNTYVHGGLPPGPIANPGAAALFSVFHPARNNYLYFVSRNDGTHVFASHYSQHLKNVKRYQIRYWRKKRHQN